MPDHPSIGLSFALLAVLVTLAAPPDQRVTRAGPTIDRIVAGLIDRPSGPLVASEVDLLTALSLAP
jgi:hypothetical protein